MPSMTRSLGLVLLAALAAAPLAGAEPAAYGPVVGVHFAPVGGAASGANQAVLTAPAAFTSVTVTVDDDLAANTYFSACIERGGLANVCSESDGDLKVNGFNSVTLTSDATLPEGTQVVVFVYTAAVGPDSRLGLGTTGTATGTFS